MSIGIVGKKIGMTRIFSDTGDAVSVTVVEAVPNRISLVRNLEKDGYLALQVVWGKEQSLDKCTKALAGHYKRCGLSAKGDGCMEFRVHDEKDMADLQVGSTIAVDRFSEGQLVDVSGTTIGKGFAGVVKRYGFKMQPATHGNSLSHRAPGSIGQNQDPGRVFKGKKMAGHMGNVRRTAQNLKVVKVDVEKGVLLIHGSVPGPKGSAIIIRPAIKQTGKSAKG